MAVGDGVSPLAALQVTFGGFSPTLMGEMATTREQVERLQEENALRREMFKRQRDREFARTSAPRHFDDGSGTVWTYVVVDDEVARIVGFESKCACIEVPQEAEGYPVYAIGPDACSDNEFVEEVICPDSLEFIGAYAFRNSKSLKRVVFPQRIAQYESSWLMQCPSIEEIVLPGLLERIGTSLFDNESLKKITIGKSLRTIDPGTFQKTQLRELVIDEENPYIKTDGTAIYSIDGTVLVALALPSSHVKVADGCRFIAKKALYGIERFESVEFPASIEVIGEFAFAHSGIRRFDAPPELKEIQQKAFYFCQQLEEVSLNTGLSTIGDSAFERSRIGRLDIPYTIESIGASITRSTNVVHRGAERTFTIDERCTSLFTDGQGGLYRRQDDGIHLIQLIDDTVEEYEVLSQADEINDHAFAFNTTINSVIIPEGVRVIGPSAFRVCSNLKHVSIADSVEEICEEAFFDTNIEEFRVPRSLRSLGRRALITYGAHHGDQRPALESVSVADGNESFMVDCGILFRRKGDDLSAVVFTSTEPNVVFPDNLTDIEDYAFNNARNIEFLSINKSLKRIGTAGLTTWCWIKDIHVEVDEPIEGRSSFDFHFPNTSKSVHGISLGIGGASWVNVPGLVAQYDICVVNAHDYAMIGEFDSIPIYDQVKLVIGRLQDPFLLTDVNRSIYERLVRNHLCEMCVDIARHDDRQAIDDLIELGFLNGDNLEQVIDHVGRLKDAAMTGYLLEVKRLRFNKAVIDFDL